MARSLSLKNFLIILMWIPMIVSGSMISSLFFREGTLGYYALFLIWPFANFFAAIKLCSNGGEILIIRLLAFFLAESALLVVIIYCS